METVTVIYHYEDGTWWAEAPAVPGFASGAPTFDEMRVLTHEGVAFALEKEVSLDERFDGPALAARRATTSWSVSGFPAEIRTESGSDVPALSRPPQVVPHVTSLPDPSRSVASSSS
jgi:predicted RNase H-like HicB family nuclease